MSRQDLLERMLRSLHTCVLDDAEWPAASGLVDEWCGSRGNSLILAEGTAEGGVDVLFRRFCFRGQRDAEREREYFEVYHARDERLPRLRELPDGRVTPNSALFTDEEKKTSAVFNEVMLRNGTRDGLNVRLDGPAGCRIVWATADSAQGDGWSSWQVEAVERILPHLRQFVRVRQALVDARSLATSAVELLGSLTTGVIELDRRERVTSANDVARALLRRRDGLSDRKGHLHARTRTEDAELSSLLARALPFPGGGPRVSGSMRVSRRGGLPGLVVHVSPVDPGRPEVESSRVGAVVLVVDPGAARGPGAEPGGGGAGPDTGGEPRGPVAGAWADDPGRRGGDGAQRDDRPLACAAGVREGGGLPAGGAGAAGAVAGGRSGGRGLDDAPAVRRAAAALTETGFRSSCNALPPASLASAGALLTAQGSHPAVSAPHPLHLQGAKLPLDAVR